jgi:TRAP transporter TAXI family solute receptor
MRARASQGLVMIAAMYIVPEAGLAQTSPLGDSLQQTFQIAQLKATSRAPTAAASGEGPTVAKINNWTVGLASGLPEGTFLRFGAEIARNLNDDGLRVLPVVTQGATDNVKDLLYLKGIDIAITNADVLEHFKTIDKIPNIEKRINFISEMHLSEVHVLVRSEINSFKDLEGKKVSFHTAGAGSSTTAPILFKRLGIKVEPEYINNAIALEKMKTGEIAGLVNNGGKPQDLFTKFKNEHGFKFLPIPIDKFDEYYVPSVLTAEDYPGYIKPGEKIETLGVPTVLAVYNWQREGDRFRRVQRFIEYYFDRFEGFQKPPYHPKWKSINLAAQVPGWTRYWVAEEKLKLMAAAKSQQPPIIDENQARRQAARAVPNKAAEQERLFRQFIEWAKTQSKQ